MSGNLLPILQKFNQVVERASLLLSIARASELQQQSIISLEELFPKIAQEKERYIKAEDEDFANTLLGCECVLKGLVSELKMWLLLKQDDPEKAWDQMVLAQEDYIAAARAHERFNDPKTLYQRLEAIEKLMFPPQIFISVELTFERLECSICKCDYENCSHLVDKPYMGNFCSLIPQGELKLDGASLVTSPADKCCRVLSSPDEEGFIRNRMTWRIEKKKGSSAQTPVVLFRTSGPRLTFNQF